jgi:metal-responsive CopG/Arc/MetJ family transcriptional regulator
MKVQMLLGARNHHLLKLPQKLTETQHHAHGKVLADAHVHLDDDYC